MEHSFELHLARFEEWMQSAGWSDRTVGDYGALMRHFFEYIGEETDITEISDIDSKVVHGYQNYLYHSKNKQGKRLTLATQYNKLVAVRSFFNYLQEIDVVLFNPASSLKLPQVKKKLPKGVMSEQQVDRLIKQPDTSTALGFRDRTIMEVMYATAIRNSELRSLSVYDVDTQQMKLMVQGKGDKQRVVPLGEIACDYLQEYQQTIRPQQIKKIRNRTCCL